MELQDRWGAQVELIQVDRTIENKVSIEEEKNFQGCTVFMLNDTVPLDLVEIVKARYLDFMIGEVSEVLISTAIIRWPRILSATKMSAF